MKGCRPFEGSCAFALEVAMDAVFEEKFREEHNPLDKSIIGWYCRACRREYGSGNDQLPITTIPSDLGSSKEALLQSRAAEIVTTYSDGRVKIRIWNAKKLSTPSNILGNLRSWRESRAGQWQTNGIAKVTVRVIENAV
jgi:hypothetical protein